MFAHLSVDHIGIGITLLLVFSILGGWGVVSLACQGAVPHPPPLGEQPDSVAAV
jgi:hypothetical protein